MSDVLDRLEAKGKIECRDGKVFLKPKWSPLGFLGGLTEQEDKAVRGLLAQIKAALADPEVKEIVLSINREPEPSE